jgi:deoxyribodipyrimidine photo-lyase
MGPLLSFAPNDPRVTLLNDKPVNARGRYVLYWSQMYRRPTDNAALAFAIARANALRIPCLVYEAVRPDYPFASDRFHTFLLEGARAMGLGLRARGLQHAFFLPRTPDEARGVVRKLVSHAALVVSDDHPAFVCPVQNAAAAAFADCTYLIVDDATGVPMVLSGKSEFAARTLRPKITKARDQWVRPLDEPEPLVQATFDLPFAPTPIADASDADIAALVAACAIDHAVKPVREFRGGASEAHERLIDFLERRLPGYADRNEPSEPITSQLSPYLHFGHISARRVALETQEARAAGVSELACEGFLEQLLVRRGLAYNYAKYVAEHTTYAPVPAWAKASLAAHEADARPWLATRQDLEDARTPDELWNAAQLELRTRGIVQNYARMLWGKIPLTWTSNGQEAFDHLVYLNDKYALDGRDPDGYASIAWCFGVHDRPWPERAIFGTVRCMTTKSAQSKLNFKGYLQSARTWRRELDGQATLPGIG